MNLPSVAQMIPVLQTAIGPMILISGLGLILLTTTNRLGRTSDRVRILTALLPTVTENKHAKISAQLTILWRRARLIRMAILLSSMSALAAAILIIVIFLTALWQLEAAWLIGSLYVLPDWFTDFLDLGHQPVVSGIETGNSRGVVIMP
jgi:hypothetical protein